MLRIELAAGKTSTTLARMKFGLRNPFCVFGLIVLWRIALLVLTAQPIPANDAFFFDGAVVNWLRHGHYFNPSLAVPFPISGHVLYSAYPPGYQLVLFLWMTVFGSSVLSAIALHLALFTVAGLLVLAIVRAFFPTSINYAIVALLFLAITFNDRPEDLAHVFGLASLWILGQGIVGTPHWKSMVVSMLLLFCALYTSVIAGAFYFGAGFIAAALIWLNHRKTWLLVPYFAAATLFVLVTCCVARFEPLWWHGFLENSRQTPIRTTGIRLPHTAEIIKIARSVPLFFVGLAFMPLVFWRRKEIFSETEAWPYLLTGLFMMGWGSLIVFVTIMSSNYVSYVLDAQVIIAAGLLALGAKYWPQKRFLLTGITVACTVLVSVRAGGMTTWGAVCAWHNSYGQTHETLRSELQPFTTNNTPVVLSSPYLYSALEFGVQQPIHSDWFYDRSMLAAGSDVGGLERLRPTKLILTQFDYYRAFVPLLEKFRQASGLVQIQVRDEAAFRTPDSIPSLQRVVQHVSWAPVIVDLEWEK